MNITDNRIETTLLLAEYKNILDVVFLIFNLPFAFILDAISHCCRTTATSP
jgi:hypothetical protein